MGQVVAAPPLPRSASECACAPRYDRIAIVLHWGIGIALLAEIVFGFLLDEIAPRGTPPRAVVINLHKSFGLLLGVLVVFRLAWRLRHRAPPWPAFMPTWQRRLADLGHEAMYVCMLLIPAAGYVASNFSQHGVRLFGLQLPPWGVDSPQVYRIFNGLHDVAAWALCALLVVHVAAALKHALIDRDGVFSRMLPPRSPR